MHDKIFKTCRNLSLILSALILFRFVFVVGVYCLVWKFVLNYAPQKGWRQRILKIFMSDTVEVVELWQIDVLVEYVRGESRSFHHFCFPLDSSCRLFLSPIQGRCDDWVMVYCG